MDEIHVRQKYLATAVSGQTELGHYFGLLGLWCEFATIVICAFSFCLLELGLIPEPLVGEEFATVHTTHGNDHGIYSGRGIRSRQV